MPTNSGAEKPLEKSGSIKGLKALRQASAKSLEGGEGGTQGRAASPPAAKGERKGSSPRRPKAPASRGMEWLYLMITNRAAREKYAFSREARAWLEDRIRMANEAKTRGAGHGRALSVWWENQQRAAASGTSSVSAGQHARARSGAAGVPPKVQQAAAAVTAATAEASNGPGRPRGRGSVYPDGPSASSDAEASGRGDSGSGGSAADSKALAVDTTGSADDIKRAMLQGWVNSEGYRSMTVTVLSADFSELEGLRGPDTDIYLMLTLGTYSKETSKARGLKPVWKGESHRLPVSSTDMFLNAVAMKSPGSADEDFLGTLQIPIGSVAAKRRSGPMRLQVWNADQSEHQDATITLRFDMSREPLSTDEQKGASATGTLAYIRSLVSKKKCRYTQGDFDLDLSYVGDKIIAMGFPSEGIEASYRNPMLEVQRFLKTKHPDHHAVYNLCSERMYDPSKFDIVKRFPFDDHNPCPFDVLVAFCKDVKQYLDAHPQNVAAIHCKAGKGRTGLTISAYLIYAREQPTAAAALNFFAECRTKDGKGVTIQSQRRYVHYFEQYVKMRRAGKALPDKTLMLYTIVLRNVTRSSEDVWFQVHCQGKVFKAENSLVSRKGHKSHGTKLIKYSLERSPVPLYQDVKIAFKKGNEKLFHFWFNTRFVDGDRLVLEKKEIDKASRDKKHKRYPAGFRVELYFSGGLGVDAQPAPRRSRFAIGDGARSPRRRGLSPTAKGKGGRERKGGFQDPFSTS